MAGRVLIRHPVALAGAVMTTVGAVAFLTLLAADLLGMFTNPYAGLVIFIVVPALFVFGLLLIPLGVWSYPAARSGRTRRRRSTGRSLIYACRACAPS